jgi:hypothetical protein
MSKSYQITACFLSFILLSACESDEAKYERLSRELMIAELLVQSDRSAADSSGAQCPDLKHLPTNEYLRTCTSRRVEREARLALAQREMNKFMGGRSATVAPRDVEIPPPIQPIRRPCTGPRPYKNWSNAELSVALVQTPSSNPAVTDLIEEVACRQP